MNIFLVLVVITGLLIKLPRLGQPFGGNFSGYQEAFASISKFYLKENFTDIFQPKLYVLVHGMPGLRMLDFPVCSVIAAIGKYFLGGNIETWGRLQAIGFTAGSVIMLYLLVKKIFDERTALFSSLFFTLSPLSIIYGRSFLNEAGAIFFSITSLCLVLENQKFFSLILSALSLAAAVSMRIQCIVLLLPIGLVFIQHNGFKTILNFRVYFYLMLVLSLPIAWYGYTYWASRNFSNVYMSLFFQSARYLGGGAILLQPDFYAHLFDDFSGIVLTPIGFTLLILGLVLIRLNRNSCWLPWTWFLTMLLTILVIPKKYSVHNFYFWHFVPVCSIFVGVATTQILEWLKGKMAIWGGVLLLIFFSGGCIRYALNPAFVIPKSDWKQIKLARYLNSIIQPDAKVIVFGRGSYSNLSYFDRLGWQFQTAGDGLEMDTPFYEVQRIKFLPASERKKIESQYSDLITWFEQLRADGAQYFIVSDSDEFQKNEKFNDYLFRHYSRIPIKTAIGILYDLKSRLK